MATLGVQKEFEDALIDVENHCIEYGDLVIFEQFTESDIVRDEYQSIESRETEAQRLEIYAFPIDFTPNENRQEESGNFEMDEATIHTPAYTWMKNNIPFSKIDINRWKVIINGEEFEINKKQTFSDFSNVHLYYVFYINKR